jgi:pyruvate ferredoxin oxidoreductase gamma subunit
LKDKGIAILNTPRETLENCPAHISILGFIDATSLALQEIGRAIVNTCMLGVIARVTGWVSLDSVILSLKKYFQGELFKINENLAMRGYENVRISIRRSD